MATASTTLKKVTLTMILANGNNSDGTVKTVNVGIGGTINPINYTDTKGANIIDAVRGLLELTLYNTRKVETYDFILG